MDEPRLLKTKWYIVDITARRVQADCAYSRFWEAVDAEQRRGRFKSFTALRGSHILEHLNRPWVLP